MFKFLHNHLRKILCVFVSFLFVFLFAYSSLYAINGTSKEIFYKLPFRTPYHNKGVYHSSSSHSSDLPAHWTGSMDIGFNYETGNVEKELHDIELHFIRIQGRAKTDIKIEQKHERVNDRTNSDNFEIFVNYKKYAKNCKKIGFIEEITVKRDHFQNIDCRIIPSVGLSYLWINDQRRRFEFSSLVAWQWTDVHQQDTIEEQLILIQGIDWGYAITSCLFFSGNLKFFSELSYTFRVDLDCSLEIPLSKRVSFAVVCKDEYSTHPKLGVAKNHFTLENSLKFHF